MAILNGIYSATGTVLKFFEGIFGNYLLAILAIALIVKLLLLPFGIKQQKNSINQAKLQPKEAAIRKKYAGRNDQATQQKMQQELMQMYQSGGYNPMSGCLPLLIQFPIIILLYNTIMNPLQYVAKISADAVNNIAEYLNAALAGTQGFTAFKIGAIRDISLLQYIPGNLEGINESLTAASLPTISLDQLPNLDLFGAENALAINPTWTSLLVLIPILNVLASAATTLLTRKLTFQPLQNGQQQGKIMNIVMLVAMPLFTGWIAFQVPAAIGIYWMFNTVLSVAQTVILYFAMPYPKFSEEDYKNAERELKGKQAYVPRAEILNRRSSYLEDSDDTETQTTDNNTDDNTQEINIDE